MICHNRYYQNYNIDYQGILNANLTRVAADEELPFELNVPNAATRAAMAEARAMSTRR